MKLGVDRTLYPYETQPWYFYEPEEGITCSAEVRMGPGGDDLETEVQFLKDEDRMGEDVENQKDRTSKGKGGDEEEGGEGHPPPGPKKVRFESGPIQQVLFMRAKQMTETEWSPTLLHVMGKDYTNEIYNWEEKGCDFFTACIQAINMEELPDVEIMVNTTLVDEEKGGGRRGRIGRKSPKVKPGQLLGMGKKM